MLRVLDGSGRLGKVDVNLLALLGDLGSRGLCFLRAVFAGWGLDPQLGLEIPCASSSCMGGEVAD